MLFNCGLCYFKFDMLTAAICLFLLWDLPLAEADESHFYNIEIACDRIAIPEYPDHFIETYGGFWSIAQCQGGMQYDHFTCDCIPGFTVHQPALVRTIYETPAPLPPPPTTTTTITTIPTTTARSTTTPPHTTTTTTLPPTPPPQQPSPPPPTTTTKPTTTTAAVLPLFQFSSIWQKKQVATKQIVKKKFMLFSKPPTETATVIPPGSICEGCKFDRGVGYNSHSTECDKYIMCYQTGGQGKLTGETRRCGVGKYWDQNLVTCRLSKDVTCINERCLYEVDLYTYKYQSDCRAYWRCESGVSMGHCCPKGHGYKEGAGCVPDLSCNTRCDSRDEKRACDKIAYPGDQTRFKQKVNGHGYIDMNCARGTAFDETLCGCESYTNTAKKPHRDCRKELEMDFTSNVKDISGSGVHVESVNISMDRGSACFHGDSVMIIPRFSNVEINGNLEIRIRYKFNNLSHLNQNNKPQALLYNGDCGQDSSIIITTNAHSTSFGLRTGLETLKTVTLYSVNNLSGWNDAKFSLHSNVMKIQQNGRTASTVVHGSVARSRCGLKIGWGENYDSFNGCIDRISISFCPETYGR